MLHKQCEKVGNEVEEQFYKKMYTVREFYDALYKGLRTMKYMKKSKTDGTLSMHFIERIMLAVTEVNGCEVCTYGHTKIALEEGMSNEEIQSILAGDIATAPENEVKAIMFAQHYADTKGNPSREAWHIVEQEYGHSLSLGILGTIRMIMIGNSYGIAFSAFRSRLKGKPIKKSSVSYELRMLLSLIPLLPLALAHNLLLNVAKAPIILFNKK